MNKNNAAIVMVILSIAAISCASSETKLFLDNNLNDRLDCDTLYDNTLRNPIIVLKVYQQTAIQDTTVKEHSYRKYRLSVTANDHWILARHEGDTIYTVSESALRSGQKVNEEIFFNFSFKPGHVWNVRYGGILGGSTLRLDSLSADDANYYVSVRPIFDVADLPVVYRLVFSKDRGISELDIVYQGDSTHCTCLS